jgi:hypothetical protein
MRIRRSLVLASSLVLLGAGAFWATSSIADNSARPTLLEKDTAECTIFELEHAAIFPTLGTVKEIVGGGPSQVVAKVGEEFVAKNGRRVVSLQILSIGGRGFVEGLGETRFWFDATRPLTSAIWERVPGTGFPAIQEMRFHFFYTFEAFPGKVFRSMNPAVMRSDNVRAFPPPPRTTYRLVKPVDLEDISEPGVVAGRIVSNRAVIPAPRPNRLTPG